MNVLTVDIEISAEMLGVKPNDLRDLVEREHLQGVLKVDHQWRISVFTLAKLLDTSPEKLLEFLEDYALGELMEQIGEDEFLEEGEARDAYQGYRAEAG
jgi:plasmid maintenance system antidote protein VapI